MFIYISSLSFLFFCFHLLLLSVFLHPKKITFVESACALLFPCVSRIGEYISLDLFCYIISLLMAKQLTLSWQNSIIFHCSKNALLFHGKNMLPFQSKSITLSSSCRGTETHKFRSPSPRTQSCQMLIRSFKP